jgi:hypothetical protein
MPYPAYGLQRILFCRPDKRSAIGHCAIAGWRRMPYPAYGSQVILLL